MTIGLRGIPRISLGDAWTAQQRGDIRAIWDDLFRAINGIDDSGGSFVPVFIGADDTFTVPENDQALFAMTIDNEGIIDVEGFLIEVD